MRDLGLGLVVMTLSARALAADPEPPAFPYEVIPRAEGQPRPAPYTTTEPVPAHPLRLSMTASDVSTVGRSEASPRKITLALDTESVAAFPVDDAPVSQVPPFAARSRLLMIRNALDDDGVSECLVIPRRLIRSAIEDSLDHVPMSAARRLRTTLD